MQPLKGTTVLDITTMLNGPFCSMLLGEMGANVIKIEPPDGDPWRVMGAGFAGVNRGKRSIIVDLKKEAGKQIVHEMVAKADILVENARWGVLHRLGMDYETVEKIKPDIIYLSILGYGPTGSLSSLSGYDPLLQSRSGQSVSQGGLGKPPVFHVVAINDMAGPMLGAYGVALALLAHKKTGKGQNIMTSLANAAVAMQAHQFMDYEGVEYQDKGGIDLLDHNATHRYYKTMDKKWLLILCPNAGHWQHLCGELGLDELITDPRFKTAEDRLKNDDALVEILASAFATRNIAEWMAVLPQADVPAATGNLFPESQKDAHFQENKIFDEREHPEFGQVMQVGIMPRFSEITPVIQCHAPSFGEHTEEVLLEMGYPAAQISEWIESGVVRLQPEPIDE